MGRASTSAVFNAPIKTVFNVIADYSQYPKFLPEVKKVSVIDTKPDKKLIELELNVVKTFRYQIWLYEKPFYEISWKFHTGEFFKENEGFWKLKDLSPDKTQVDYQITAKFGV